MNDVGEVVSVGRRGGLWGGRQKLLLVRQRANARGAESLPIAAL